MYVDEACRRVPESAWGGNVTVSHIKRKKKLLFNVQHQQCDSSFKCSSTFKTCLEGIGSTACGPQASGFEDTVAAL
jgi:hypothetical protein